MDLFREHAEILQLADAKVIIRNYNKLARALVKFEMVWHEGWCQAVEEAKAGLSGTLLVRHERTGKLYVNFDQDILKLMRETKTMQRMDLHVPSAAVAVALQEGRLKMYVDRLQHMLLRYDALVAAADARIYDIVQPHFTELLEAMEPVRF